MFKPDFGKSFFQKHQSKLVALANTWLGRRFFGFKSGFGIGKDFRVMALYPNAVSGNWKIVDGKLIKRTIFSTDNHYQMRLERAWKILTSFVPSAVAWKMLSPQGALSLMPLVAMTVFNPDADPETTSVDGSAERNTGAGSGEAWGTIRAGAGTAVQDNSAETQFMLIRSDSGTDNWQRLWRSIFLFDTSAIGDTDSIDAAVLSLYGTAKLDNIGITPNVNIYTSTPASNTFLGTGDYSNLGTTAQATAIAYASWSTTGYNDFTLNATGRGNVSKTGVSKFGLRNQTYDADNSAPTWAASQSSYVQGYYADNGSNKPKLDVTHTAAAPDPSVFDTVTVAEDITMMVDENPNVNDAVTVAEDINMNMSDEPNVFDAVTVSESITLDIFGGPEVNDTVTVTESVTMHILELVPEINDAVTVTEAITMHMEVEINVNDGVTVSESVSAESPLDLPTITDDVAITESVSVMVELGPSIFDAVTVTDTAAAAGTGVVVAAARDGLIHMRSTEQSYPLMMDEDEVR